LKKLLENPDVFRSLNERIAEQELRRLELICECDAETCMERVVITPVEFREVQRHRGWYVVRPGHALDEADRVVAEEPAFVVIEKESRAA
jgi:hypothetical protein